MLQKLQISKTTTFSESSGRQLSHGTPLYRSYIFRILSNLRFSFSGFCVFLAFWHEITLQAIDIDNIGCLQPFLPHQDHYEIRRFLGLICKVDLALSLITFYCAFKLSQLRSGFLKILLFETTNLHLTRQLAWIFTWSLPKQVFLSFRFSGELCEMLFSQFFDV